MIDFKYIALTSLIFFSLGIIFQIKKNNILSTLCILLGILPMLIYIIWLWSFLQRPPIRKLGEVRLFYSFFLACVGYIVYLRWKYTWFLIYSLSMSLLFLSFNVIHPENFDKTLMPALHSPWFVPHVVVYIFAYAMLGASAIVGGAGLIKYYKGNFDANILKMADNIVYIGFAFLTLGLVFGALWAKEAWGHYWTWDPKETWAFLTWACYLVYIHLRFQNVTSVKPALWMLSLAFVVLLTAWYGVNYLPSAQSSVHVYSK